MENRSTPSAAAIPQEEQNRKAMERFVVLRPHLEEDVPLSRAAQQGGVPLRTAERWLARYRESGLAGLARQVRSDAATHQLPNDLVELIEGMGLNKPLTASGIPATSWWPGTANRCAQNVYCYVQGDYVSIASNSFAGASTPFITSGGSFNAFRQLFLVDPPGDPIAGNFKPNFVPFPAGADLRAQGKEHGQQGADPGRRHERRKQ